MIPTNKTTTIKIAAFNTTPAPKRNVTTLGNWIVNCHLTSLAHKLIKIIMKEMTSIVTTLMIKIKKNYKKTRMKLQIHLSTMRRSRIVVDRTLMLHLPSTIPLGSIILATILSIWPTIIIKWIQVMHK